MPHKVNPPAWGGGGGVIVPPAFSKVTTLGSPLRVWNAPDGAMNGGIAVTVMGALLLGMGIVMAFFLPLAASLPISLVGAAVLALGLWNLRFPGPGAVVEYDEGFAVRVRSRVSAWRWDELASITSDLEYVRRQRGGSYTSKVYTVLRRSGEKLVVRSSDLEEAAILVRRIKDRLEATLLPPLKSAYDAGQTVTFGPVSVSRDAIGDGRRQVPWSTVAEAHVKQGCLVVVTRDGARALRVRASKIPNIEQLCALVGIDPGAIDLTYV